MRIKMQCPDCGKWFTLVLSVKESRSDAASDGSAKDRPDDVQAEHSAPAGGGGSEDAPPPPGSPSGKRGSAAQRRAEMWPLPALPVVLIVAAALVWIFAFGPAVRRSQDDLVAGTPEPTVTTAEVRSPESERAAGQRDGAAATAGALEDGASKTSPAADETVAPLELRLAASERCWVRVMADGRAVADLTLEAGESGSWGAERRFMVSVGSGRCVDVYLNGELLGKAGRDSRVVEGLVVNAEGMKAVGD